MLFNKSKTNIGFTLIEILVVIGIFTVIMSTSIYFLLSLSKKEALEKDVAGVTALLRGARMLSVASKNASPFGVHLENDKAVLFEGSSYVSGGSNEKIFALSNRVYLQSYSLNNGGQDIIFSRLLGDTQDYGSITLSLKDNSTSTMITILRTGVVK